MFPKNLNKNFMQNFIFAKNMEEFLLHVVVH